MDWTGLDWTDLLYKVQPCIPTVILKNHVTVAKQEGGEGLQA